MPYEWLPRTEEGRRELHLWPYRSLPKRGFVWFIGGTAALISVPLFAVLGTVILWGLLPFLVAAVAAMWWALARSYRAGELTEVLRIGPQEVTLVRREPGGREQSWQANTYWVALRIYPTGGKVPHYLTLKGEGREVELGAFLSEEERLRLAPELREALSNAR